MKQDEPVPFRAMVEASVSPFVLVDGEGYVTWVGPTVHALLGQPPSTYVGKHFLEVLHPSSHEKALAAFADFMRPEREHEPWVGPPMQLDLVGTDGPVTCEVSAVSARSIGRDGAILQVRRWRGVVLLQTAVDAIAANAALDEVLRRLIELLEHDLPASTGAVGTGWDGERFGDVVALDPSATSITRLTATDAPWARALATNDVASVDDVGELPPMVADAAASAGYRSCWAFPIRVRPDPSPSVALVVWRHVEGGVVGYLADTVHRIAGLIGLAVEGDRTRQRWQRAARTDELTGLSNRTELDERLDELAATTPDDRIAVLFCDLDDFKPVNDGLGHDAGDEVLADVAGRIRHLVRPIDVVARWGGDEFVVLCAGPASADDAVGIARRFIDEVNKPLTVAGKTVRLGVSIGVATAIAGRSAELIRRADVALQEAKRAGKNAWRLAADEL